MKKKYGFVYGLLVYIVIVCVLFKLNVSKLFQPLPALSVLSGTFILTISQYSKKLSKDQLFMKIGQNALVAGLIASLFLGLSVTSSGLASITSAIVPSLYGSFIFLIFAYCLGAKNEPTDILEAKESHPLNNHWNTEVIAQPIFVSHGFSQRECHVALKIVQGASNKEIAEALFITEATVKKHIQNIYKKCEVGDRQSFINVYLTWLSES